MSSETLPRPPRRGDHLLHAWGCDWHTDQITSECSCGLTAPRPPGSTLTPRDGSPYPVLEVPDV